MRNNFGTAATTGGPGQLVQNVNPGTFFGGQQAQNQFGTSIFGTQAGLFSNSQANQTARRGQNFSLAGDIIGAGGLVGAAKFG